MHIEIKSWITGAVLYATEADSLRLAVEAAIKNGAYLRDANLGGAHLSSAYLRSANLDGAYLRDANLSCANLSSANLSSANLSCANLSSADLSGAYLRGAHLSGADLSSAYLRSANLDGACLRDANLSCANLSCAYLSGAYLSGANLSDANLDGAHLSGADLDGTCLDPLAILPLPTAEQWRSYGFEVEGDKIWCWRTAKSQHVGSTDYTKPGEYAAPVFSVDQFTACHPGIYFGTKGWMESNYKGTPLVRGYVLITEAIKALDKFRAKRFFRPEGEK